MTPLTTAPRKTLRTPVAYRVITSNGTLVLCDLHLELLRLRVTARLTGETFAVELCDHCLPEEEV